MHHGEVQQFALIPVSDSNSNSNPSIISSATYTANGEYVESITDSRGNTTNYEYNMDRGYLKSQTNPNGVKTSYSYYDNELLKSVSLPNGTNNPTVTYSYDDYKRLAAITSPSGTVYGFTYDSFSRNDTIKLGSVTLSQYLYDSKGRADTFIYGNGNTVKYGYDELNRQASIIINDALRYNKQYDGHSRLLQIEDLLLGKKIQYEYDILDRAVSEELINVETNTIYAQLNVHYDDSKNRVAGYDVNIEGVDEATDYVYGENQVSPDMITSVKHNGTKKLFYGYDGLNRLVKRTLGTDTAFATEYTYIAGKGKDDVEDNTGLTTNLVKTLKNGSDIYEYTYDKLGNITQIKKNDIVIESYAYDNLNQLIAVVKGEDVYAYTYDGGGNILSVFKNGVVEDTYTYDNAEWKDLLTAHNGQTITYDAIGNPLTYRDEMSFTWSDGRKLATITRGTDSISYTYDANGLRNSKTVNGTTTDFYWLNGTLYGQKTGNESMYFLYDENGTAYGFILDKDEEKSQYYYEFNVQGDIIGVIDSTGTRVVEYTYDAWGNPLSITGTLADTIGQQNPLRYRGYYYDAETGFYYVSSRYYNPEIGRFLNADSLINQSSVIGNNMFAYCLNNPVNMADNTGHLPFFVVTAAIGAVAGAVVGGVKAAKAGKSVLKGALVGAAVGGLAGAGLGAGAGIMLAGSATATTTAVASGAGMFATAVSTGGIGSGAALVIDNISRALNNTSTVLYSGGKGALDAATDFADKIGGTIIDSTAIGKIASSASQLPGADFTKVWSQASAVFCNQASGVVNAFVSNSAYRGIDSIFWSVEMPTLLSNPKVTEIIIHIF